MEARGRVAAARGGSNGETPMTTVRKAIGAGALVLLAAGCRAGKLARESHPVRSLETARVERQVLPGLVEVDGAVVGRIEAVLSSRLAVPVMEVSAVPGQEVRAGTVLVRLDVREAEGALAGTRAELAAARSALDLAAVNRLRFEKLESRGAAAAVELERARQSHATATAGAASAEAAVRRAEIDRSQALLAAPFDAIVVEKMVSPGDLAVPGRPLVRLASRSGRRVETAPGEEDAARLSVGQIVPVVVGGRVLESRVAEIAGAVDPATRRRIVRLDLPAGEEPPVGSFARVRFPGAPAPKLLADARAIVSRGGLELAWVVEADGGVVPRYVRTAASAVPDRVEARSGLEAGDRVVLDPPADLEAGTRVHP